MNLPMAHDRVRSSRVSLALCLLIVAGCGSESSSGAPIRPAQIENPAAAQSGEPNLSVAPDGSVLMSWLEPVAGEGYRMRFSRLRGEVWGEPRTVVTDRDLLINWADFPSVVQLPDDRLVAHYLQRETGNPGAPEYGVRIVQSSDDGATWSAPVVPHRVEAPSEYGFVSIFPTDSDAAGIVWLDGRNFAPAFGRTNEMALRFTTLAANGELGDEVLLDPRVCDCCQTSAAMTNSGPVIAYRDRSADEIRDISVVRHVGREWSDPVSVHEDGWRIAACPVNGPSATAAGDFLAIGWFTAAAGEPAVHLAMSSDAGNTFEPPLRIDEGDPVGRVAVAVLPDRSVLVAWLERSGPLDAAVRFRRVDPAGHLSSTGTVGSMRSRAGSGFPRIAAGADQVVFAWTEPGEDGGVRTAVVGH
jgi:hypothetical protein